MKARKKERELLPQGNRGKPKALYLEQKNFDLVLKSLVGEVSDNRSV